MRGITQAAAHAAVFIAFGLAGIGSAAAAGALAAGACGAYGQAFGYRSVSAAEDNALQHCKAEGCRIVATLRRSCAALAVDVRDPCSAHGSAHATRLGTAQNEALRQCYRSGGKDCVIRTFVCDGKGRG